MKRTPGLMAHLVADYPNRDTFIACARALQDGGADILELQIPFSDPTADGPIITAANEQAVANGFRVQHTFEIIDELKNIGFQRIVLMTYSNIVYRYGVSKFLKDLKKAGIYDFIVPDFPLEDEECFYSTASQLKLNAIPVAVPNMNEQRLRLLQPFPVIYVSLRVGTTGGKTAIDQPARDFLAGLGNKELFAGFGIQTRTQIKSLRGLADYAVVGSYFTRIIAAAADEVQAYQNVLTAINRLKL